jgi:hypothetical protein
VPFLFSPRALLLLASLTFGFISVSTVAASGKGAVGGSGGGGGGAKGGGGGGDGVFIVKHIKFLPP